MRLAGRHLLVGICGGIAGYKIPSFIRLLIKEGAEVQAVVTKNGSEFVGKAALSTLTGRPVITDLFPETETISTEHISASHWADGLIIAPATANCIGKCANGIADDFLSTLYLSLNVPVIFAPAMNTTMWNHDAVQQNVNTLKKRGDTVIEPDEGGLACGDIGKGRLPSEEVLLFETVRAITVQSMKGMNVIVTAGGTEEAIDPVRVIANRSSGKMGVALAKEAWVRGANVTLICGAITTTIPKFLNTLHVVTASEMKEVVEEQFTSCDTLIMAAAVSDFTPVNPSNKKRKKGENPITIELKETSDILQSVSKRKEYRKIIGFALEDENGLDRATQKMVSKGCDLLVLNGPDALSSDTNSISILTPKGSIVAKGPCSKEILASDILDAFLAL